MRIAKALFHSTIGLSMVISMMSPAALWPVLTAKAESPSTLGYQGRLKDAGTGEALEGTFDFSFDIETAGDVVLWTEDHDDIDVTGGYFSVTLGEFDPFDDDAGDDVEFTEPLFLVVRVKEDSEVGYDTLAPDITINTVPYAMTTRGIETDDAEPADNLYGGRMYYNTTTGLLYVYNDVEGAWQSASPNLDLAYNNFGSDAAIVEIDDGEGQGDLRFDMDGADFLVQADGTTIATFSDDETITFDSADGSSWTVDGDLTLSTSSGLGSVIIDGDDSGDADAIFLDASDSGGGIVAEADGDIDMESFAGGIFLDADATSNFSVSGADEDLTIEQTGGGVGELNIASDGTTATAIDIDAFAGGITIDADLDIEIDSDSGSLFLTSDGEQITLNASLGPDADSNGDDIELESGDDLLVETTDDVDLDIGGDLFSNSDTFDIAATGPSFLSVDADAAADDLTIAVTGAFDSSLVLVSSGTGADAVDIDATAGGITLDAAGAISLDAAAASNFTTTGAGIDITIDSTAGSVVVDSGEAAADALLLTATGGTTATAHLTSNGTGTAAIDIDATGAGGDIDIDSADAITVDAAGALDLTAGAASNWNTTAGDLTLSADAASVIVRGVEAAADAVLIDANNDAAGGIDMDAGTGGIALDSTGAISLDAAAASNFTTTGAGIDITIDSTAGSVVVDSGEAAADALLLTATGGTTATAHLTSNGTGTAAIDIDATGAGGDIDIDSADAITVDAAGALDLTAGAASNWNTTAGDITIDAEAASVVIDGGEAATDAVRIIASAAAGGIDIDSGTGDIDIDSSDDISIDGAGASAAISIGTSAVAHTITLGNATSATSVNLDAGTGGVDVDLVATGVMSIDGDLVVIGGAADGDSATDDGDLLVVDVFEVDGTANFDGTADFDSVINVAGATVTGDLIPSAADTYDLGSAAFEWAELYLGDGSLFIGNDQDASFVYDEADDDSLEITGTLISIGEEAANDVATAAGDLLVSVDLEVNGDAHVDGATFDADVTGAISLDADLASNFNTSVGDITIDSETGSVVIRGREAVGDAIYLDADNTLGAGVQIDAFSAGVNTSGTINMDAGTGGVDIDIVGDGDFDVLAGGTFSIDGTGDGAGGDANITYSTAGDEEDFTISLAGATDSSLVLSSTGTSGDALRFISSGGIDIDASEKLDVDVSSNFADAVSITASAGGIDITAVGADAGEDIDISNTGGGEVRITSTSGDADALRFNATGGGGMDFDTAGGAFDFDSAGGEFQFDDGLVDVGTGVYTVVDGDNDLGVAGDFEVLGTTTISGALTLNDDVTMNFTGDGADSENLEINFDNDVGIDNNAIDIDYIDDSGFATTGYVMSMTVENNGLGAGTGPNAFLFLESDDTNETVPDGVLFDIIAGGTLTDAIDAQDPEITNALNVGDNTITGTSLDLDATTGAATIDSVTSLSIDVSAATAASNISVAADADAEDLTIATTGTDGDLVLSSADDLSITATDLLSLTGSDGTATSITLDANNAAGDGVTITPGTGGLDVDSTGVMSFDGELVAIGTAADGGFATGDGELYVIGDIESDANIYAAGTITSGSSIVIDGVSATRTITADAAMEIKAGAGTALTIFGGDNGADAGDDLVVTSVDWSVDASGAVTLASVDADAAAALSIGAATATAVNIADTTIMTTIEGTLNVDEAVTLDTTLGVTGLATVNGGVTADGGVFTVADTSGDVHTSGTLDVDSTSDFDGTADFSAGITNSAGELLVSGGNLQLNDTIVLSIGTGDDLSISHDGTNTTATSATGDLIIDNTDADDQIIIRLGTDTAATALEVRNNSDVAQFTVAGDGVVTVANDLNVTDDFSVEGIVDFGTDEAFGAADTTPTVASGSWFRTDGTAQTLTDFDDGADGQVIIIESTDATVFDCATAGPLICGDDAEDITTADNDITMWVNNGGDAGNWHLISYVDVSSQQTGADLAEYFPSYENLNSGELVSVDPAYSQHIKRSTTAYDPLLVGVIATEPGFILGRREEYNKLALAGRVPTKVTSENGPILPGDYITSSSTPGAGMKATEPGMVVGMALEGFSGETGSIIVKVFNSWYVPPVENGLQGSSSTVTDAGTVSADGLVVEGDSLFNGTVVVAEHLVGSADTAGRARIVAGDERVHVSFTNEYAYQPIVTVTQRTNRDIPGYYWVEEESTTGFDIVLDGSLSYDMEFNWIALGVDGGKVSVSDGSTREIDIYVVDGGAAEAAVDSIADAEAAAAAEPAPTEEAAPAEEPVPAEEAAPAEAPAEEPVSEPVAEEPAPEAPAEEPVV